MVRLGDIVSFRRDLLFSGAVQVGWLESNPELAAKAAGHFAFHGPSYHGVAREALQDPLLRPVDTATFVLDVVERITGKKRASRSRSPWQVTARASRTSG